MQLCSRCWTGSRSRRVGCAGYLKPPAQTPLLLCTSLQPPGLYSVSHSFYVWNSSAPNPGPIPWVEVHPDREISTALASSFSRYPNIASLGTPEGVTALAAVLANVTKIGRAHV